MIVLVKGKTVNTRVYTEGLADRDSSLVAQTALDLVVIVARTLLLPLRLDIFFDVVVVVTSFFAVLIRV